MTTHTASTRRLATFAAGALILAISGCGSTPVAAPMKPVAAKAIAPVRVSLLSPRGGTKTTADHVTVRGTVSPANAVVLVQGRAATVANGVFVATASVHRGRTRIDVIASARDATPASAAVAVTRPLPRTAQRTAAPVPATVTVVNSGGPTTCGDGLSAGPNTTCAFAANVRSAYADRGPGTVVAYSPVTQRSYVMNCSAGATVVCTGGDNASVYFAASVPAVRAASTACGGGLAVGPNTTCPFAANVRAAYLSHGSGTVVAYSPVTHRRYAMTCVDRSPVVCTGGDDASVYIF